MRYFVFSRKSGRLLYEIEKMNNYWVVSYYDGKMSLGKYLTDEQLEKIKKNKKYLFNEAISFGKWQ